jgi:hypothetical protein
MNQLRRPYSRGRRLTVFSWRFACTGASCRAAPLIRSDSEGRGVGRGAGCWCRPCAEPVGAPKALARRVAEPSILPFDGGGWA